MNSVIYRLGMLVTTWSLAATAALAGGVAAKKDEVPVLSSAANNGAVIAKLKKDQVVEAIERKGMFWQVKLPDGKTGFVSVLSVNRKSDDEKSSLAKSIRSAAQEGREGNEVNGTRSRSSVMGVRGLDESDESAQAANVTPSLRMVYSMEDRKVSHKKIEELGNAVASEIERKVRSRGTEN